MDSDDCLMSDMETNLPSTSKRTCTEIENSDHLPDLGEGVENDRCSDAREANNIQEGIVGNQNINGCEPDGDDDMIILDQDNDLDEAVRQHRVSSTGGEDGSGAEKGEVTVPEMEDDVWAGFEDGGGEVIMMDSPDRKDDSISLQV